MAKINPIKFLRQVRQEVSKVTWPTRKETAVTTGMVLLLGTLAAVFFLIVDQGLSFAVQKIIGLGK
jgi:preprotein translocase subunit SecE